MKWLGFPQSSWDPLICSNEPLLRPVVLPCVLCSFHCVSLTAKNNKCLPVFRSITLTSLSKHSDPICRKKAKCPEYWCKTSDTLILRSGGICRLMKGRRAFTVTSRWGKLKALKLDCWVYPPGNATGTSAVNIDHTAATSCHCLCYMTGILIGTGLRGRWFVLLWQLTQCQHLY